MDVILYVVEEVTRQGHNVQILEGIQRVEWMLRAWTHAIEESQRKPTVSDAILIGQLIEPKKNKYGVRMCNVVVGSDGTPHYSKVGAMLDDLFRDGESMTPMEFYKAFELIHPFLDGNGRTGKVLLNWLNGTLLKPIFPPNDLFGTPITNP